MAEEYRIEMRMSAEELIKFGQAVAAICFFPKLMQSELRRLNVSEMPDLDTLTHEAHEAAAIGEWLAVKIGSHEPERIQEGPLQ